MCETSNVRCKSEMLNREVFASTVIDCEVNIVKFESGEVKSMSFRYLSFRK